MLLVSGTAFDRICLRSASQKAAAAAAAASNNNKKRSLWALLQSVGSVGSICTRACERDAQRSDSPSQKAKTTGQRLKQRRRVGCHLSYVCCACVCVCVCVCVEES